jgi:serine/threonine protein kinase
MAPESVSNDPIDGRTDIYSLGVMLFEMLTGKLPLESETTQGFMTQHLICPPLTLEEVDSERKWPPELESLLERMLAKTRDERPDSCSAILAELEGDLAVKITGVDEPSDEASAEESLVLDQTPQVSKWGFKGLLGRLTGKA